MENSSKKRLDYRLESIVYTLGMEEASAFEEGTGLAREASTSFQTSRR
jgi:hypothetical protein